MNQTFRDRRAGERETAAYIASLAGELAEMAGTANLPVLRYLLDMARDEATLIAMDDHSSETRPPE